MHRIELIGILDDALEPHRYKDYAPNGLQVEGKAEITKVLFGVTASEALIDVAIAKQADAIIVHHGYFWKNEDSRILGIKRRRLAKLLAHDINLIAYHLPLDAHPQLGNNVQLAEECGWIVDGCTGENNLLWYGHPSATVSLADFANTIEQRLQRAPLVLGKTDRAIHRIAWCTGGADSFFPQAIELGVDLFITGEASEPCAHLAAESDVAFIAAGHHATERGGVRAMAAWLDRHEELDCEFVDLWNPI